MQANSLLLESTRSTTTISATISATTTATTITTSATATTEATTASTATTTSTTLRAFVGVVNADVSAINGLIVHAVLGVLSARGISEGNKAEATRATSLAISQHNGISNLSELREDLTERVIGGTPGKVADEELGHY